MFLFAAESESKTPGESLQQTFDDLLEQVISQAPKVIYVVAVIIIGYIVAKIAARLCIALCEKVGLQQAAERGGLVASMKQVGIRRSVPAIIGTIVFWLLMCIAMMAVFNILELTAVSDAMQTAVNYIPRLLSATVVIVVGLLVATFLRGIVATGSDRVGIQYGQYLANAAYYLLVLMTFVAALDQLDIKYELLNYAILIVFAAIGIAFGISVGLGGRDVVSGILAGYYVRQRIQSGDFVTVAGIEGRVREVGPVATVIEIEEDGLMNRRTVPNIVMLNEAVR